MRQLVWHEADSYLHRLNPLTKLALTVPVAVLAALADRPVIPVLVALVAAVAIHWLGRVPWPTILRALAFSLLLGVGIFWSGTLFYAGPGADTAPLAALGPLHLTEAGLLYGLTLVGRLLAIFAASLLFVLTTDPVDVVLAMIQQARLPVRVGYAVFAAYRFVPLVQEELANIRAAHQVRGAATGRGPLAAVRRSIGYAIPLLAISVRRAERVALAMDARGFGARPDRTYYRTTRFGRADLVFAAGATVVLAVLAALPATVATLPSALAWAGG